MKKPIHYLITVIVISLLSACGNSNIKSQLDRADSLIAADSLESALSLVSAIDTALIDNDADRAHYYLLNSRLLYCLYRPTPDISQIREASEYYATHGNDYVKLANACYYQAMLEYEAGNNAAAAHTLKKAEEAASHTTDINLHHKIFDSLTTINFITDNDALALKYAKLALDCAVKTDDSLWLAYAYNHLAIVHSELGHPDSAWTYIQKCIPYTRTVDEQDRARIFYMIGDFFLQTGKTDLAADYISQSYAILPTPQTTNRLAGIYNQRGEKDKAMDLWKKALATGDGYTRSEILDIIATQCFAEGNYREASLTLRRLLALRDSLSQHHETVAICEIQLKYDQQANKRLYDKLLIRCLYGIIGLILLITAGTFYHLKRSGRARRKMMSDQILINDYNRQINDLHNSGRNAAKDISRLQQKLDKIQSEQSGIMFEGRALYDSVVGGRSVVTWSKSEVAKFIEYYKAINLPFVMQIEHDYSGLTDNNRLFLILQDMGKNDTEISQALGISPGAIRTIRYRLRAKKA